MLRLEALEQLTEIGRYPTVPLKGENDAVDLYAHDEGRSKSEVVEPDGSSGARQVSFTCESAERIVGRSEIAPARRFGQALPVCLGCRSRRAPQGPIGRHQRTDHRWWRNADEIESQSLERVAYVGGQIAGELRLVVSVLGAQAHGDAK